MTPLPTSTPNAPPVRRDPAAMLEQTMAQWDARHDLWLFGYGSLIWRPDFEFAEQRPAKVHGWHRALKMWSRVNRGTPECPGLVFALLTGGSCRGMVFRIDRRRVPEVMPSLWAREMVNAVYDPRWLPCQTPQGTVSALAFTLSRRSPNHTGVLPDAEYTRIFAQARGRYGTTHEGLVKMGIHDRALARLLALATEEQADHLPKAASSSGQLPDRP
jgi:cation transport protein ChaC